MFADRSDAGRRLAARLAAYKDAENAVVLAIPRGGLPVGAVLARELRLPLDVVLTKKIGHPLQPEYAVGVVDLKHELLNERVIAAEEIPAAYLAAEIERIRALLRKRSDEYCGGRPPVPVRGRTAILTDDGLATGSTMKAAIRLAREDGAAKLVVAVPVAPASTLEELRGLADEVVCVLVPDLFQAIGQFYEDFTQVSDEEAIRLLRQAG